MMHVTMIVWLAVSVIASIANALIGPIDVWCPLSGFLFHPSLSHALSAQIDHLFEQTLELNREKAKKELLQASVNQIPPFMSSSK